MEVKLDLHIHSEHSPDGRMALDEIVACARARGLQGVAVCDHDRALTETWDAPDFLLIPGIELSTDRGHLLGLFVTEQIEARELDAAIDAVHACGGLAVMAHPFERSSDAQRLDAYLDRLDGIEVWNSAWSPANERAVELWHTLLVGGNRKFAVASTDFHRGGNIASPHTVVRAEALSAEAVIDAIAAGRSYVARDTSAEIGMQVRNSATPVQHADIGDTLLRSGGMQAEFRSNTAGRLRLTDQQGWFSDTSIAPGTVVVPIPERSLWVRAELRAEDGSMIALTNPIYIQHPLTTQSLLPE